MTAAAYQRQLAAFLIRRLPALHLLLTRFNRLFGLTVTAGGGTSGSQVVVKEEALEGSVAGVHHTSISTCRIPMFIWSKSERYWHTPNPKVVTLIHRSRLCPLEQEATYFSSHSRSLAV